MLQLDAILQLCSTLLSIRQAALPHIIDISSSWITDSAVWKCIRTAQASNTLNCIGIGKFNRCSHHSCLNALLRCSNQDEGFPRPCVLLGQNPKHLHMVVLQPSLNIIQFSYNIAIFTRKFKERHQNQLWEIY